MRELLERCDFPSSGTRVTCAVSGGPDSLALMVLAIEAGCLVTAIHVDHGLRHGSDREAEVVREAAERFGAAFHSESVSVAAGPNLEARAREARHRVLPPGSLLGHTADDQAETVLLNMVRGAGVDGLAGMRSDGRRPLLRLRRVETRALCERLRLRPIEDPMNLDTTFRRVRVRHELLPLLDDIAQRDVVEVLARQSRILAEVADHISGESQELDPTDARGLAEAPPALARDALRRWLRQVSDSMHPPDLASVDRVMNVVRGEVVAAQIAGGWTIRRTAGRLRMEPPSAGMEVEAEE